MKLKNDLFILLTKITVVKNKREKLTFTFVGAANTVVDFLVYTLLIFFGTHVVVANYISSAIAMTFSYFANKHITFKSKTRNRLKESLLFISTSIFGAWILQPLTIVVTQNITSTFINNYVWLALLAKIAATFVSLIWSYLMYSRVVFIKSD